MMRLRFFALVGFPLAVLALGCSAIGVEPQFRYKVTERFRARPGAIDVTGVRVTSALSAGRLSDAELEKLGSFLSAGLRKTTIGVVVNLNGRSEDDIDELEGEGAEGRNDRRDEGVAYVVTVDVMMFKAATQDERRNRIHSELRGNVSMRDVATDRSLGSAIIWARGSGLDLDANYASDTIREFFVAMRQVIH